MNQFNLLTAKKRAKTLNRHRKFCGLRNILIPITAYIGSIITIFCAWFMRTGSFQFQATEWTDWIISLLLALTTYSGVHMLIKNLSTSPSFVIKRKDLINLLAVAKTEADLSVANIGGDLSWLKDDFQIIKEVKRKRPGLKMQIYYDRSRVPKQMIRLINQLIDIGIDLVPYPVSISPSIRCMLIDRETPENCHVCIYPRFKTPPIGEPRSEHMFLWQEFGPESPLIINSICALVKLIDNRTKSTFRLGISGINNVGKTQLSKKLRDIISSKFKVMLFMDQFRITGENTSIQNNYAILLSQLMNEHYKDSEICIYDRTLLDNFCFLCIRSGSCDSVYQNLAKEVAEAMNNFDLIIDVTKSREDYSMSTTHVTGEERKAIRCLLTKFYATHNIDKMDVVIDVEHFEQSIHDAAIKIAAKVIELKKESLLSNDEF